MIQPMILLDLVEATSLGWHIRLIKDVGEIQIPGLSSARSLCAFPSRSLRPIISFNGAEAEFRHDLAQVLGDERS